MNQQELEALKPGDEILFDTEIGEYVVERVECIYDKVIVHAVKRVQANRFEAWRRKETTDYEAV